LAFRPTGPGMGGGHRRGTDWLVYWFIVESFSLFLLGWAGTGGLGTGEGLSVRPFVHRGLETQITFKTIPPNSKAQKLFKTSITHFYFFTYWVSSPKSRPIQVPSPNAQASNYLLGCLWSKSRTVKKNLAWAGRRPGVWNHGSKY